MSIWEKGSLSNMSFLWTQSGARLKQCRSLKSAECEGNDVYNWIFLPGGPGLGSESLAGLIENFVCPGILWSLDLPGDGSNTTADDAKAFSHWSQALVEAVSAFDNVILVAHSTGGMYALATPALKQYLSGLVLMDSAPNASWQNEFMVHVVEHSIPEVQKYQEIYEKHPNNDSLRNLVVASLPYLCADEGSYAKFDFLKNLPYNFRATEWSSQHFDCTYEAAWTPESIPTLIFAGDQDHLTPLSLFKNSFCFQGDYVIIEEIPGAGHYPWVEKPDDVQKLFVRYFKRFFGS